MRQSGALMKAGTPDLCHWGRGIAPVVPAGRAWELRRPGRARATVAVATEWQDNWLLRRVTQSHLVAGEPVDRLISDAAVDGRTERQARCVAGAAPAWSPIWRSGCQGVGVDGHVSGWWCGGDVVAACGAVRASAGSRRLVMLIFGGWVPQDLCSSHVRCLKSSAAARVGGCSGDESRSWCARAGEARAASPAATGMSNGG